MLLKKTIDSKQISTAIDELADAIARRHSSPNDIVLAGIADGGLIFSAQLAEALEKRLNGKVAQGIVDISFHRDDIGLKPITKDVKSTEIQADPEEVVIILVDDVLHSGRTVRAAMAEVHSLGRPLAIELAVLVDRGNRKLPIEANYTGMVVETDQKDSVDVMLDADNPQRSKIEVYQKD